eukprot:CAMPEP_0183334882 /NCGR_PEP_ID=MMETSP0164_2-20130417/3353_1 /TAXON_ID=221442 /ORGANISM="Coccolithus pelagicus ssp braarudi, Strain PLY182g" /LENGTH=95 /DNA_ID=CAMNT_0025504121 /DNA_START=50 /DNA_END=334 /DNA_ORIENTATION=+
MCRRPNALLDDDVIYLAPTTLHPPPRHQGVAEIWTSARTFYTHIVVVLFFFGDSQLHPTSTLSVSHTQVIRSVLTPRPPHTAPSFIPAAISATSA